MEWIPDPGSALVLIKRIEAAADPLPGAVELFWAFFGEGLSSDAFASRAESMLGVLTDDEARHFTDPEVDAVVRWAGEDPAAAAALIVERLDAVADSLRPTYSPDEPEDPSALLTALHLDAARLYRALKEQGFSEDVRTLVRLVANLDERTLQVDGGPLDAFQSRWAVRSLRARVEAHFAAVWDNDYESALRLMVDALIAVPLVNSWHSTIDEEWASITARYPWRRIQPTYSEWVDDDGKVVGESAWPTWTPPWIADIENTDLVEWFAALQANPRGVNWSNVAGLCTLLRQTWEYAGRDPWDPGEAFAIPDSDEMWDWISYWQRAAGWSEAQVKPSEIRSLIGDREDAEASQRLGTYFFPEGLWERLPNRSRDALVSADRMWVSSTHGRRSALLNELKVATEQLLFDRLWEPFWAWHTTQIGRADAFKRVTDLRDKLNHDRHAPAMSDYRVLWEDRSVKEHLLGRGLADTEISSLRKALRELYAGLRLRGTAEHEPDASISSRELGSAYAIAVGIGKGGVLPLIAKLLLNH